MDLYGAVWIAHRRGGENIMAAIVAAVAVVASFITWKNGGGTPLTEEESK